MQGIGLKPAFRGKHGLGNLCFVRPTVSKHRQKTDLWLAPRRKRERIPSLFQYNGLDKIAKKLLPCGDNHVGWAPKSKKRVSNSKTGNPSEYLLSWKHCFFLRIVSVLLFLFGGKKVLGCAGWSVVLRKKRKINFNCFAHTWDAEMPNTLGIFSPENFSISVGGRKFFCFRRSLRWQIPLEKIYDKILQQLWGNVLPFQTCLRCERSPRVHPKKGRSPTKTETLWTTI